MYKSFTLVLGVLMLSLFVTACTTEEPPAPEPTVSEIEVTTLPTKTEYYIGETFDPSGGFITATYTDDSTTVLSFSDTGVTLSEVSTQVAGQMTVTVRYMNKSARFTILVVAEVFNFVYDLNYESSTNITEEVVKGNTVTRPTDPTREGFVFDGWYMDESLTILYNFDNSITSDTVVYAKWLENATYYDVVFNYNHPRLKVSSITQKVKENNLVTNLSTDPTRVGYEFAGWYTDAEAGDLYDFDTPVTDNLNIYAHWTRTVTGINTYIFEAEDTNLAGKTGPGLSGTLSGPGMIQYTDEHGASNDRFVGYMYEYGVSLEFNFVSDMAVTDATLVIRLSAEIRDFDISLNTIRMSLNNQDIDYGTISFVDVPPANAESQGLDCLPFQDYVLIENATLKEGFNIFQIVTTNYNATEGTTLTAIAPLVDCIKITTSAVLTWDDFLGLPKDNY